MNIDSQRVQAKPNAQRVGLQTLSLSLQPG
jgi:hypothetical protein